MKGLYLFPEMSPYRVPLEVTFLGIVSDRILNKLWVDEDRVPLNVHRVTNEIQ